MSVIVRNNPSVGVGGSTSKGFPPGDITNIIHTVNDSKVLIKWTDPEDTIVDNVVFVKWKGTLLVRNNDHYPNSIKDGDIVIDNIERNKYKDTWYEDTGLTNDITYYYRFFTYSDEKVYNDSGNLVFKEVPLSFAPIFKDNTWEQITAASESGNIPSTWNIGDEIDINCTGPINKLLKFIIVAKNNDYIDENKKAGLTLMIKSGYVFENITNIQDQDLNSILQKYFDSFPLSLKNVIKDVHKTTIKGTITPGSTYDGTYEGINTTISKIFVPTFMNIYNHNTMYDINIPTSVRDKYQIYSFSR